MANVAISIGHITQKTLNFVSNDSFYENKACHPEENSRFYSKPKRDRLKICLKCFFKRKFQKVATLPQLTI
jgi:hypothetical protein